MAPRSLFPSNKVSLAGLVKKLGHHNEVIDEASKQKELPPMPYTSSKAARVLGVNPATTDGKAAPASAPLTTTTPNPFKASGSTSGPSISSNRQQLPPIPEQASTRWLLENGYSTSPAARPVPTSPALSQETHASALGGEHNQPKNEAMILGDGKISPTKSGSYGRMVNVEIVEGAGRVPSVRGVLEYAEPNGGPSEQRYVSGSSQYSQPLSPVRESAEYGRPLHSAADTSSVNRSGHPPHSVANTTATNQSGHPPHSVGNTTSTNQISQAPQSANNTASTNQDSRLLDSPSPQPSQPSDYLELLQPTVYSPNDYAGIWEKDPHVGKTLPPFSPKTSRLPQRPEMQIRDSSTTSSGSLPIMFRGSPDEMDRPHDDSHASTGSSIADLPNSRNNSFAAPVNSHLSAAVPQPLFTVKHNFVPAPSHHPDFQPSTGPAPPALVHLGDTMHHHIDSIFASLTRTVIDKHERGMDEITKRFDALEERLDRGLKHRVAEKLGSVRKEIKTLTQSVNNVAKTTDEVKDVAKELGNRLEDLEKSVEEHGCKCAHCVTIGDATGHNYVGYERGAGASGGGSENLGTGNTQHMYGQHPYQIQQHGSAATRSQASTSGRQSANSNERQSSTSNGRRSTTASGPANDGGRPSGESSGRRAYFADMGRATGPEPDLRAHPAFAGHGIPTQEQVWPRAYGQTEPAPGPGSEVVYQVPSFSGGAWYNQAYGH